MSPCSFAQLNARIQKDFSLAEVLIAVTSGGRARGITMRNSINMGGGAMIDSFDSSNPLKSTKHLYDVTKCQSHGHTATLNSDGTSDLKSTYLHGNLAFSGAVIGNTLNISGGASFHYDEALGKGGGNPAVGNHAFARLVRRQRGPVPQGCERQLDHLLGSV
jgi:hypothetical protein